MHWVRRQSQRREAAEAEASFSNFTEMHKLARGWKKTQCLGLIPVVSYQVQWPEHKGRIWLVCYSPQSKIQTFFKKIKIEAILIEESIWTELRDKEVRTCFWPKGDNLSFQDEEINRGFSWPWIIRLFRLTH